MVLDGMLVGLGIFVCSACHGPDVYDSGSRRHLGSHLGIQSGQGSVGLVKRAVSDPISRQLRVQDSSTAGVKSGPCRQKCTGFSDHSVWGQFRSRRPRGGWSNHEWRKGGTGRREGGPGMKATERTNSVLTNEAATSMDMDISY